MKHGDNAKLHVNDLVDVSCRKEERKKKKSPRNGNSAQVRHTRSRVQFQITPTSFP